jgi:nuclear pore complex protein Nup98-Nup96
MQPYSRYSFEELRVADYQGGRRYANASGQPGAFGSSAFGSGFGAQQNTGFGSGAATGGFGAATSAPAFGGATQTQTAPGFGSGTTATGSLFGAAKPATSLFGSAANNAATTQPSLFGGNTATAGGFGQTANTGTGFGATGGSVFGNNQQAQQQPQQNKSLFGGGSTTTGFGTGGGFGANTTATPTNPFGGNTTSAFGNQQQQAGTGTSTFGGFGAQPQNQTQAKPGGLFGSGTQQQQGGTGLFGNTNTGTSLFGQNNQQQQQQQPQQAGGSLFGAQPQQTGTGVFGGNQQQEQKPSLFGGLGSGTNTNTGTGFGGLGGAQNAQTGTPSLFGNTQAQSQQQKPGSLFGTGGGSLFGQSNTNQNTGSAFGSQPQQQQAGSFGTSSLFSQQNQQQQPVQQQPAPGSFQASLLDGNPYGNQSIFSGLPVPNAPSPGPLATPLSASMKQKQRTPLPVYKITPNAANRLITPPRRQGYGFSYSTYGSPSSASSVSSLTGSLLGNSVRGGNVNGSLGRSFGKSFSTSNLRNSFDPDSESVLTPGAITGGQASRYSSGSLKRLTIDRSLKSELFTPTALGTAPITNGEQVSQSTEKYKKRVSFDAPTDGALVRTETETPETTAEELGFIRSARKPEATNGTNGSATQRKPEMEVRGKELAVVPEHTGLATNGTPSPVTTDPQPGQYWMKPSRLELSKMSREQLKHVENFTVGRQKCGQVTFGEPVDLTNIDLDSILGDIVKITVRSITVYADDASKPPLGKGLNVPSTLRLENSWPRGRDKKVSSSISSGPFYDKHVQRLQRIKDTEFVGFERETGVWIFRVPHFTTYGLDYEDDEGESLNQSTLSAGPDTPTPKARSPVTENTFNSEINSTFSLDESFVGSMAGVDDDTFDFKKRKMVPGAFGDQIMQAEDEGVNSAGEDGDGSFLEDGSTGSVVERDAEDDMTESIGSETGSIEDEDMEMAGSFPIPHQTVEHDDTARTGFSALDVTSDSMRLGTPTKPRLDLSGDWAQQLQRTISPRKQDRETLRVKQGDAFVDKSRLTEIKPQAQPASASPSKTFTSSIDVMQSLFSQPSKSPGKKQKGKLKAFEVCSPSSHVFQHHVIRNLEPHAQIHPLS